MVTGMAYNIQLSKVLFKGIYCLWVCYTLCLHLLQTFRIEYACVEWDMAQSVKGTQAWEPESRSLVPHTWAHTHSWAHTLAHTHEYTLAHTSEHTLMSTHWHTLVSTHTGIRILGCAPQILCARGPVLLSPSNLSWINMSITLKLLEKWNKGVIQNRGPPTPCGSKN